MTFQGTQYNIATSSSIATSSNYHESWQVVLKISFRENVVQQLLLDGSTPRSVNREESNTN